MSVSISQTVEETSKALDLYWEELMTCLQPCSHFINDDSKLPYSEERNEVVRTIRTSINYKVNIGTQGGHSMRANLEELPAELHDLIVEEATADEEDILGVYFYTSDTNIFCMDLYEEPNCIVIAVRYKVMTKRTTYREKQLGEPVGEPIVEYVPALDENGEQRTSMEYLFISPMKYIGAYESPQRYLDEFSRTKGRNWYAKQAENDAPKTQEADYEDAEEARRKRLRKMRK